MFDNTRLLLLKRESSLQKRKTGNITTTVVLL
jgi:hypothetical protein